MNGKDRGQAEVWIAGIVAFLLFLITVVIFTIVDSAVEWITGLAGQATGLPASVGVLAFLIALLVGVVGFVGTLAVIASLEP